MKDQKSELLQAFYKRHRHLPFEARLRLLVEYSHWLDWCVALSALHTVEYHARAG
jgi:hypothetical protein